MIKIYLKNTKQFAVVDDEDEIKVKNHNWHSITSGKITYASTHIYVEGKRIALLLHRLILNLKPGDSRVDHRNRNGLDCRKVNLRLATQSQNLANTEKYVNNKSGYKGVSFYKPTGKYVAQIKHNNVKYNLGYFLSKEEAAIAYNNAAKKFHGEFAWLNNVS